MKPPRIGALSLRTLTAPSGAAIALVALTAAGVSFVLGFDQAFGIGDEGMQYFLARAWAKGTDISQYGVLGPYLAGQYVWLGTVMRLLGDDLWVLRLGRAVLTAAGAVVLLRALARQVPPGLGLAAAWTIGVLDNGYATPFASVLVLSAGLTVARGSPPGRRAVALLAVLAGALAGFREDSAVIALALALAAVAWRRKPLEMATVVVPAAVAGFLPWVLIAVARGEVAGFLTQVAGRFAEMTMRVARPARNPWTLDLATIAASPRQLFVQLVPLLAVVPPFFYCAILVQQWCRHRRAEEVEAPAAVAALCGLAYVPQYLLDRMDLWHLRAHLPVFLIVLAVWAAGRGLRQRRLIGAALLTSSCLGVAGLIVQHRLAQATPYPRGEGSRIGVTLEGGAPPWAGLERRAGETLVVLGFGPGWYVVEGIPAGTRQLSPIELYLRTPALRAELLRDLAAPSNRWVITDGEFPPPRELEAAVIAGYQRSGTWRKWTLFTRR